MPSFFTKNSHRENFTTKGKEFIKLFANALFRAICAAFQKKECCKKFVVCSRLNFQIREVFALNLALEKPPKDMGVATASKTINFELSLTKETVLAMFNTRCTSPRLIRVSICAKRKIFQKLSSMEMLFFPGNTLFLKGNRPGCVNRGIFEKKDLLKVFSSKKRFCLLGFFVFQKKHRGKRWNTYPFWA